jgi:hypothetical protein
MGEKLLMVDFLLSGDLVASINKLMYSIHNVTFSLLSSFLIIYILFVAFKMMLGEGDIKELNIPKLLFILFLFFTYESWAVSLGKVVVSIANAIYSAETDDPFAIFKKVYDQPGFEFSIYDLLTGEYSLQELIMMLAMVLIFIATAAFSTVQVLLQAFLYIMGPLAIAISIIPVWKSALMNWFKNFMAVNLWSVFFAVFLALFTIVSEQILSDPLHEYAEVLKDTKSIGVAVASELGLDVSLKITGLCIITLVGIVMIPSISSKIIPDAGIGGVGSVFSGITTLAGMAGGVGIAKKLGSGLSKQAGKGALAAGSKAKGLYNNYKGNNPNNLQKSMKDVGSASKAPPTKQPIDPPSAGAASYFSQPSSSSSSFENVKNPQTDSVQSQSSIKSDSSKSPKVDKPNGETVKNAYKEAKSKFASNAERNAAAYTEPVEEPDAPKPERARPNYPPNYKLKNKK